MAQSHGSKTGRGVWWNNRPWETPLVRTYTVKTLEGETSCAVSSFIGSPLLLVRCRTKPSARLIWALSPDFVCMTGDMLERRFWKEAAGDLMEPLAGGFPVFLWPEIMNFILKITGR